MESFAKIVHPVNAEPGCVPGCGGSGRCGPTWNQHAAASQTPGGLRKLVISKPGSGQMGFPKHALKLKFIPHKLEASLYKFRIFSFTAHSRRDCVLLVGLATQFAKDPRKREILKSSKVVRNFKGTTAKHEAKALLGPISCPVTQIRQPRSWREAQGALRGAPPRIREVTPAGQGARLLRG